MPTPQVGDRGSSDKPPPAVNIEFHQAFVSHFQQEGLAHFFFHDVGTFHYLIDFERLLADRPQDIFSIIQHDYSLPSASGKFSDNTKAHLP
jgi:hypothetical protein